MSKLLRVYFMDTSHKTVYVDPDLTTIERLWEIVSEKLLLSPESAECFFIWQISKEMEVLLYAEQTIQEAYDEWPKLIDKYAGRATLTDNLKSMVIKNENEMSPTKLQLNRTKSKSGAVGGSPKLGRSPSKIGNLDDGNVDEFQFVYRPTSVLPMSIEHNLVQPEAVHLLYVQAVHHVINSNYPCMAQTAIVLSGVQLQIQLGDQKPDHSDYVKDSWESYVPEHLRASRKSEEWVIDINTAHKLHKGKNALALKTAYLQVVRQWPFYGCTFFKVKGIPSQTSFFKQEYEGTVVLGINHYGIHVIHPSVLKFETWKFRDLVYWDNPTPATFAFQVVTGMKQEPTRTYKLKAAQAELINDLVHDWSAEWETEAVQEKKGSEKTTKRASKTIRKSRPPSGKQDVPYA